MMCLSMIDIEAIMLAPNQLEHFVNSLSYEFFLTVLSCRDSKAVRITECVVVHQFLLQALMEIWEG